MVETRKVNNPLALAVLAYLSREPMHPYQLSRTLREHGKERSIKFNNGSLYMVVGQLVKAGFVAEYETSRAGNRPERTVYTLTAAGRQEWRAWLRELVEEPRHEHPQFVVALSLIAALSPAEVVDLLSERRRRVVEQCVEIRTVMEGATAQGVHPLFQVDEEYRLALLIAEASFLQSFITRIDDPENGWGTMWAAYLRDHPSPDERHES
jgi:DNA-binding PadR family transcriptional regulator